MTPLETLIHTRIRASGPLSVADYMALCLYHPQHGYYTTGRNFSTVPPQDFTTAPELTPLFGYTLAQWVAAQWRALGNPTPFSLIECGPGRGTLMRDMLAHLQASHPGCHAAANPVLVETSPALTALQKQTLAASPQCTWQTALTATAYPAILVTNEFLDAFPVEQAVRTGTVWHRRVVTLTEEGHLAFATGEPLTPPHVPADVPDGTVAEWSPAQAEWLANLPQNIAAALLCDYGAAPLTQTTLTDTLQAMHAHSKTTPFSQLGDTDLTTHVNFTLVAIILGEKNVTIEDLAPFLLRMGLPTIALQHPLEEITLQRLLHPAQMGMLFKVLCYTRTPR